MRERGRGRWPYVSLCMVKLEASVYLIPEGEIGPKDSQAVVLRLCSVCLQVGNRVVDHRATQRSFL